MRLERKESIGTDKFTISFNQRVPVSCDIMPCSRESNFEPLIGSGTPAKYEMRHPRAGKLKKCLVSTSVFYVQKKSHQSALRLLLLFHAYPDAPHVPGTRRVLYYMVYFAVCSS